MAIIAGGAGGFAGTLLNGGNLGQALVAGVIGGAIGGAAGFLNYAAGLGTTVEKMVKHAFVDTWLGGVQSAVNGG